MEDSGGAGKNRGGSGTCWEVEPMDSPMTLITFGEGRRIPAMGAAGARSDMVSPKVGRLEVTRNGETRIITENVIETIQPGERAANKNPGGGGYGNPFEREIARVVPDLVTMTKGLAGGFPLSAVTGRAEIVDAPNPGGIGGTYAGNPLAVAPAHAVLDVIAEEKLCARAAEIGETIRARLTQIASRQGMECIGEVRGLGAMNAFELVTDRATNAPDAVLTSAIVAGPNRAA